MHANWFDMITGFKLSRLRKAESRTLKEAAEAIGVTPQFISSVEKGRSGISFAKLQALLEYYHCSMAEAFPKEPKNDIFIHLEDAEPFDVDNEKIYSAFLFPRKDDETSYLEPLYHRFEPGAKSKESKHSGAEFYFILSGALNLNLKDKDTGKYQTYHMVEGDSLHIAPWIPHYTECPGPHPAEALAISSKRGEFIYSEIETEDK